MVHWSLEVTSTLLSTHTVQPIQYCPHIQSTLLSNILSILVSTLLSTLLSIPLSTPQSILVSTYHTWWSARHTVVQRSRRWLDTDLVDLTVDLVLCQTHHHLQVTNSQWRTSTSREQLLSNRTKERNREVTEKW